LFGPNIFFSTLLSNTPSLCPSLNVRDQVSHPYGTIGKIIVLYVLIFKFFYRNREDRRFWKTLGIVKYITRLASDFNIYIVRLCHAHETGGIRVMTSRKHKRQHELKAASIKHLWTSERIQERQVVGEKPNPFFAKVKFVLFVRSSRIG
jgi:hypothetical protein